MEYGFDVYITGITGFLGRNLVDHLLTMNSIHKIYGISRRWDAQEKMPVDPRLKMVTGDIRDPRSVKKFFALGEYQHTSYLIHAAAYKHVPMGENNVMECVGVNIEGTKTLLENIPRKMHKMVMISTDKAVEPVNVYGQTKAIAERLVLNHSSTPTLTSICRFGNVFGSTGSVVEKWADRLIGDTRPLFRIADAPMTRYWYRIDDAVKYVVHEMVSNNRNAIVVPILKSSSITKLLSIFISMAKAMGKEVDIKTFPVRPGEKRHESMAHQEELSYASLLDEENGTVAFVKNAFDTPREIPDELTGLLTSSVAQRFTTQELTIMLAAYLHKRTVKK